METTTPEEPKKGFFKRITSKAKAKTVSLAGKAWRRVKRLSKAQARIAKQGVIRGTGLLLSAVIGLLRLVVAVAAFLVSTVAALTFVAWMLIGFLTGLVEGSIGWATFKAHKGTRKAWHFSSWLRKGAKMSWKDYNSLTSFVDEAEEAYRNERLEQWIKDKFNPTDDIAGLIDEEQAYEGEVDAVRVRFYADPAWTEMIEQKYFESAEAAQVFIDTKMERGEKFHAVTEHVADIAEEFVKVSDSFVHDSIKKTLTPEVDVEALLLLDNPREHDFAQYMDAPEVTMLYKAFADRAYVANDTAEYSYWYARRWLRNLHTGNGVKKDADAHLSPVSTFARLNSQIDKRQHDTSQARIGINAECACLKQVTQNYLDALEMSDQQSKVDADS